jgi:hypothetical protein
MHQVQDLVLGHHWCLDESPLIAFTARACFPIQTSTKSIA